MMLSCPQEISDHRAAALIYYRTLFQLFKTRGDELDEERIVKSATGIKNTTIWRKLFKFQRDGFSGAVEKLERFGGCIIADSVGFGKTFEALAIVKYYELRNDRVLVLVHKRLHDNWTLYKANDRRNILAEDHFNYDVLNHTDLSRDSGTSETGQFPERLKPVNIKPDVYRAGERARPFKKPCFRASKLSGGTRRQGRNKKVRTFNPFAFLLLYPDRVFLNNQDKPHG